jgi:cytochrome c oxidase assembly protein subunit 15
VNRARFVPFAWALVAYNLGIILWGAWVRASGSGAGCGEHWPLCNGEVIPQAPTIQTIIEYTHRITSGLALILTVVLVVWAHKCWPRQHRVRKSAWMALVFILLEALLGAGLVVFGLVGDDASPARALVMMVHLGNTFMLLTGVVLAAVWAQDDRPIDLLAPARIALAVAFGAILMVGFTGAIAALGDTLFPAGSLTAGLAADLDPRSHFLLRLRALHPVFAVLTAGYLVALAARWRQGQTSKAANGVILVVCVQICAGFLNLGLLAPVWLQLVHLLLADLVWIATVLLAIAKLSKPRGVTQLAHDES